MIEITGPIAAGDAAAPAAAAPRPDGDDPALRRAAEAFEAAFLAEMLKHAGVGKPRESFGGGAGEQGFADFLTVEYAAAVARTGRLGLADAVYAGLKARAG